jgi:hypothetical protein
VVELEAGERLSLHALHARDDERIRITIRIIIIRIRIKIIIIRMTILDENSHRRRDELDLLAVFLDEFSLERGSLGNIHGLHHGIT